MAERTFSDGNLEHVLDGLRITVIGRGPLGLMSAFALAQNGAAVQIVAASPLKEGLGFKNAAGLIEPVATLDGRASRWTRDTTAFCNWAAADPRWGVVPRSVLFLSDDEAATQQDWMDELNRRDARPEELRGGRAHGAWFESHVIQPDRAAQAIVRECRQLAIIGGASDAVFGESPAVASVEEAANAARMRKADLFLLAPGMGLAELSDIEELVGLAGGLSGGMGLTIRIPAERFDPPVEHVLMDDDDLGYLIPQLTHVVAGGTNDIVEHDDPTITAGPHPALVNEWEAQVRNKMERLCPGSSRLKGDVRVGARPLRGEVLTHWTDDFAVPGMILGGAGGSGWTFSVGIAHDVCRAVARRFNLRGELLALGTLTCLDPPDIGVAA